MAQTKINVEQLDCSFPIISLPQYLAVGSPTIGTDDVISGFTASKYVTSENVLNVPDTLTSFEIVETYKKTSTTGGATDGLFSTVFPGGSSLGIRITSNNSTGAIRVRISFDGSTDTIDETSGNITNNTKTTLKLTYSADTGYKFYTKTEGGDFSEVFYSALTTFPYKLDNPCVWGLNGSAYLRGEIYMRECYINVNGARAWTGVMTGKVPMILN